MAVTFTSLGLGHLSREEKMQVVRDLEEELEKLSRNTRQFPAEFNSWEEWIFHIDHQIAEEIELEKQAEAQPFIRSSTSQVDRQGHT